LHRLEGVAHLGLDRLLELPPPALDLRVGNLGARDVGAGRVVAEGKRRANRLRSELPYPPPRKGGTVLVVASGGSSRGRPASTASSFKRAKNAALVVLLSGSLTVVSACPARPDVVYAPARLICGFARSL
jgi:hypothetical protein